MHSPTSLGPRAGTFNAVTAVSVLLLTAVLLLRLYAAWNCVPVCIWDDSMHREQATDCPFSLPQIVRRIMLPTTENRIRDKTMGYYLWLVMGSRLFGGFGTPPNTHGCSISTTERAWQLTNVLLLLIQLLCVYGVARWASQDRDLSLAVTTLYLMCPIVFGMNRWVLTENHVMAALWMAIAMTVLLTTARRTVVPLAAAVGIGMFSSAREYALPLLIVLALAGSAALLRDRRYTPALGFFLITASYLTCAVIAAAPAFQLARQKLFQVEGQKQFWNPFPAWLAHMFMESWGPSLTVVLLAGSVWVTVRYTKATRASQARRDGLVLLWASLGLLGLATMAGAYATIQRLVRPSIPPFIFCFAFVLVGLRVTAAPVAAVRRRLSALMLCALVGSAALLAYHLFVRFDRGQSYKPHAAFMEYYDHPLWIRPLTSRYDRHYYSESEAARVNAEHDR